MEDVGWGRSVVVRMGALWVGGVAGGWRMCGRCIVFLGACRGALRWVWFPSLFELINKRIISTCISTIAKSLAA